MTELIIVLLVCSSALAAWVLYLAHVKWTLARADKQRDEVLATLEPRIRELESLAKSAQYGKLVR